MWYDRMLAGKVTLMKNWEKEKLTKTSQLEETVRKLRTGNKNLKADLLKSKA